MSSEINFIYTHTLFFFPLLQYLYGCSVWFCVCRQFAEACGHALDVNERLIKEDQFEYQGEMKSHYRDMLSELSAVMNEQVSSSVLMISEAK